ncbi:DHA2 family efflux MFS transporter permease subunit [Embleya sp. NPDC005971]|uniref:DHA2 family efflux MFS transporter permease subunit n=1 Tax=Embleya sp. NPDC005971 TaxID=3156724 RepID=UPI0033C16D0D
MSGPRRRRAGAPTAAAAAPHVARSGPILAVLACAQFVVVLSTSIVNVALPQVRDGVGLSGTGMAWVINAYGLAFGALLLLGGRVADLLGRRRVLNAGLVIFTAASAAAGIATGGGVLIAARAAQGVGAAAVAPAALSLVMQVFPPGPARGKALGVWGAVSGAGGAAGVLLGGVLTEGLGWRAVFFASALAAAAVLAVGLRVLPDSATTGDGLRSLDIGGALAVTLGLVALVYGLTTAGRSGWTDTWVLASIAVSAVLLVLFAVLELRHPRPLLPPRLVRVGAVAPANVVMALLGGVWVGLFFFLPLYQQQVLGDSPLRAGVTQLPLAVANMIGAAIAPRLARRIGATPTLTVGMTLLAAGLLWLSQISADGSFTGDILGPTVVVGLGLGAAFVQLTGAAVTGVPAKDGGLAGGLVNTTRQIGGALGLAVLGTLAASRTEAARGTTHIVALTDGYRIAFLVSAAIAAVGTALTPLLARRATDPATPTPAAERS